MEESSVGGYQGGNRASALRTKGVERRFNFFEIDFLLPGHGEIVSRAAKAAWPERGYSGL
jgi:hypothetical protein